jgi:hypothetical protein
MAADTDLPHVAVSPRIPLSFDFDGVLSEGRGYHWPVRKLDLTVLRQALDRGYAVHVLTANDVDKVAWALASQGIDAVHDACPRNREWLGGPSGRVVLVTNRKLKARAYVDDRALRWQFGDDPAEVWAELDRRYPPQDVPRKSLWRRLWGHLNPVGACAG